MKILVTALIFYLFVFPFSDAKAETAPKYIIDKCKNAVLNRNPVKITYNYGTLSLDLSKNKSQIKRECNGEAAGCFFSVRKSFYPLMVPRSIKINEYTCQYVDVNLDFDFSGSVIYIVNEYTGCTMRAVLRHELQHFTIWKTTREKMLYELKNRLLMFIAQNVVVCRNNCSYDTSKVRTFINSIVRKWRLIEDENDKTLDRVDHAPETMVNYPVCAPYSKKYLN